MNFVFSFPIAILSQYFFGPIIFLLSLFMVLLILVQRGKGGGLTGALGGPGGQSAFGTKAGDLFTRITIVAAACWIFLLAFCVWWYTESGFSSALADNDVIGNRPGIGAPANTQSPASPDPSVMIPPPGTGETGMSVAPVVPATTSETDSAAKPNAEVGPGDLPAKTSDKPDTEATKTTETPKSAEPTDSKPDAAVEKSEPKPDSSKIPTPEK